MLCNFFENQNEVAFYGEKNARSIVYLHFALSLSFNPFKAISWALWGECKNATFENEMHEKITKMDNFSL